MLDSNEIFTKYCFRLEKWTILLAVLRYNNFIIVYKISIAKAALLTQLPAFMNNFPFLTIFLNNCKWVYRSVNVIVS